MSGTLLAHVLDKVDPRRRRDRRMSASPSPLPPPRVQLLVTPIGPKLPKLQAYHSSIVVDGVEYSFGNRGIVSARGHQSHRALPRAPADTRIFDLPVARRTDVDNLMRKLGPYFRANTYDLLRKNCNSFTDCALHYLLGQRLDKQYRCVEQIAHTADRHACLIQALSGGGYQPNRNADGFSVDRVILEMHATPLVDGMLGHHGPRPIMAY